MLARRFLSALLATGLLAVASNPATAAAKKKAAKPADATGQCDDGTYTRAKNQQGACSSHGGVKTWYGEPAAAAPAPAAKTSRVPKPARTSAPTTTAEPEAAPPAPVTKTPAKTAPPAGTPADATAKCKDGTYSHSKHHSGTCSHHGGVAEWYK
jgi:hypothetical protein